MRLGKKTTHKSQKVSETDKFQQAPSQGYECFKQLLWRMVSLTYPMKVTVNHASSSRVGPCTAALTQAAVGLSVTQLPLSHHVTCSHKQP